MMCSGASIGSVGTLPNGAMKKVVILVSRWLCGGAGSGSVGLRCCPVMAPLSRLGGRQRRRLGAAAGGRSVLASDPAPAGAWPGNDRKSTRLNSSHITRSRMPSSA